MANTNDLFVALTGLGLETAGNFCFGSWKDYALLLQPAAGGVMAGAAVQLTGSLGSYRKAISRALKEKGLKGVRLAGLTKTAANFMLSSGRTDSLSGFYAGALDALTAALRESGIAPADHCAITGAARPDSLCLVTQNGALSYRPVSAAAIRDKEQKTREKVEENRENGNYVTGFVGALIGMLVGLIPNLLSIIFAETIWSLLFALVPLCAMFGYKLTMGKMNKGAIAIVVVLSLLAVLLIPMFELSYYLVHDYGMPLGEALRASRAAITDPAFLSEITSELLQLLLFMALGIWIAWKYMSRSINSSQLDDAETQLATLRPNPRYAQTAERDG